jgi:hypothetical protein
VHKLITLAAQALLHLANAKASTVITFNDEKKLKLDMVMSPAIELEF